jgi:hypothetical protein
VHHRTVHGNTGVERTRAVALCALHCCNFGCCIFIHYAEQSASALSSEEASEDASHMGRRFGFISAIDGQHYLHMGVLCRDPVGRGQHCLHMGVLYCDPAVCPSRGPE